MLCLLGRLDYDRIWKHGSWLRVDSTIVGIGARFKLQRGRLSLVFMGKNSETPGVLLRIDHTKEKVDDTCDLRKGAFRGNVT